MLIVVILVVCRPAQYTMVVLIGRICLVFLNRFPASFVIATFQPQAKDSTGSGVQVLFFRDLSCRRVAFLRDLKGRVLIASASVFRVREDKVSLFNAGFAPVNHLNVSVYPLCRVRGVLGVFKRLVRQGATLLANSAIAKILAAGANDRRQRQLAVRVFAGLRVFVMARAFNLVVTPWVALEFAKFGQTGNFLPVVGVVRSITVDNATAQRARGLKFRVHRDLYRVNARAVLASLRYILQRG